MTVTELRHPAPPIIPIDRSLRMRGSQYVPTQHEKTGIVLHHTVGGSARSTFDYWAGNAERVGTAYQIDRDGTIYEHFDPSCWAYHLGLRGQPSDGYYDQRTIGIELCSEGPLVPVDGTLHAFYNPKTKRGRAHTDPIVDLGTRWREWRYFDAYDPKQVLSLISLVYELLERFPRIPRRMPSDAWRYDISWLQRGGVYGHAHVRMDKSDPHPMAPWRELRQYCRLQEVA